MSLVDADIAAMTLEQRIELMGRLWDSLPLDALTLTPEQEAELARRSDELDEDVAAGRKIGREWSTIRASLRRSGR